MVTGRCVDSALVLAPLIHKVLSFFFFFFFNEKSKIPLKRYIYFFFFKIGNFSYLNSIISIIACFSLAGRITISRSWLLAGNI